MIVVENQGGSSLFFLKKEAKDPFGNLIPWKHHWWGLSRGKRWGELAIPGVGVWSQVLRVCPGSSQDPDGGRWLS